MSPQGSTLTLVSVIASAAFYGCAAGDRAGRHETAPEDLIVLEFQVITGPHEVFCDSGDWCEYSHTSLGMKAVRPVWLLDDVSVESDRSGQESTLYAVSTSLSPSAEAFYNGGEESEPGPEATRESGQARGGATPLPLESLARLTAVERDAVVWSFTGRRSTAEDSIDLSVSAGTVPLELRFRLNGRGMESLDLEVPARSTPMETPKAWSLPRPLKVRRGQFVFIQGPTYAGRSRWRDAILVIEPHW